MAVIVFQLIVNTSYRSTSTTPGLCTCGAITLELITISFKKYVVKRVIQNWVENIPFSWVLSLLSCVCILSSLNAPWAYHLWIRRNINYTYYYYYYVYQMITLALKFTHANNRDAKLYDTCINGFISLKNTVTYKVNKLAINYLGIITVFRISNTHTYVHLRN